MTTSPEIKLQRNRFLDLLRLVAVLRVVLLHTFTKPPIVYFPWIEWIFPGMAEVFFVSGVVGAISLAKRGSLKVVALRLRRLLPPYYAYAFFAALAMAVTSHRSIAKGAKFTTSNLLSFLLPIARPVGSPDRVVLWGHLWFLTTFLWVIVLSPLSFWIFRKSKVASMLIWAGAFVLCVALDKFGYYRVREDFYTVAMFGWFFQLGYLYNDGYFERVKPKITLALAGALFGAGWLVAMRIEPIWRKVPNELYASQSGHFLIGGAWMIGVIALEKPIALWLNKHKLAFIDVITKRTYTLFIWGPCANAIAIAVAKKVAPYEAVNGAEVSWSATITYLIVTILALIAMVLCFGWVEDIASRRKPRLFIN